MNFSSLPASPAGLKSVNPYLQRAKEMEKVDPVISYWCAFHAAQTCMSIGHNQAESRDFLMGLLDLLEHAKSQLSDNDAITNNLAATAYVENFALKIFDGADKEDQHGLSTRTTAQRFLAAACFLEVLQSLTNQPEPDIIQKIKYSKWKAGSISKGIRDGNYVNTSQQQPANEPTIRSPVGIDRSEATVSKETEQSFNDWPTELGTNTSMSKLPSPISAPNLSVNNSSGKPSPFPSTVFPPSTTTNTSTTQNTSELAHIPTTTHLSNHLFPIPPTSSLTPPTEPDHQSIQQTFYSTPAASVHLNSTPSSQTMLPIESSSAAGYPTHSLQTTTSSSSNASASQPVLPTNTTVNPIKVAQAQKHAKWAISALNFDDISTAKNQLQIAIDTLNDL
ncbi:hypothetical protein MJO28_004282 [Puccinia striiformis f. sp. tritici]|uniref:Uncharacterized protein n=1 Tax=Puccinia striiformis f. sp. tritici TaxID=168172 RepID=A0ACC0EQP3_9BASI|nr:hypothetical protein Pst134EB_008262 [Puccinia striiformis f. sp. tritici]KAI7957187.1 hypothetical protein MJO28_004282 [Puccinia striiformis f. sp. tritici]